MILASVPYIMISHDLDKGTMVNHDLARLTMIMASVPWLRTLGNYGTNKPLHAMELKDLFSTDARITCLIGSSGGWISFQKIRKDWVRPRLEAM